MAVYISNNFCLLRLDANNKNIRLQFRATVAIKKLTTDVYYYFYY